MLFHSNKVRTDRFKLTKEHLILLQRMHVDWEDRMYDGAPAIDIKRPYGNKSTYEDIAAMLRWRVQTTDEGWVKLSEKQKKQAEKLHKETEKALQICLSTQSFEAGTYQLKDEFNFRSWHKIK